MKDRFSSAEFQIDYLLRIDFFLKTNISLNEIDIIYLHLNNQFANVIGMKVGLVVKVGLVGVIFTITKTRACNRQRFFMAVKMPLFS